MFKGIHKLFAKTSPEDKARRLILAQMRHHARLVAIAREDPKRIEMVRDAHAGEMRRIRARVGSEAFEKAVRHYGISLP